MRRLAAAAAIMLMPAPPALAQPATEPPWLYRLPDSVIRYNLPLAAQRERRTGEASVQCRIDPVGVLQDCKATGESPAGQGFGEAAVRLARCYRVRSRGWDGSTLTAEQPASLTIQFTPRDMARVVDGEGKPAGLVKLLRGVGAAHYPEEARFQFISGRVVLHCRAAASGALTGCAAASETPVGLGFGRMALLSVKRGKVETRTQDGAALGDRFVELPVVINPPGKGPPNGCAASYH